jgi:hypothetical protein
MTPGCISVTTQQAPSKKMARQPDVCRRAIPEQDYAEEKPACC